MRSLAAALPEGAVVVAIVDAAAFARRFAGLDGRIAERREAWRTWGEASGTAALVVDLEAPDAAGAEPYLQSALDRTAGDLR